MSERAGAGYRYLAENVSVPVSADENEILNEVRRRMKRRGMDPRTLHFRLYKQSVDARKKEDVRFVCTVLVESSDPLSESLLRRAELKPLDDRTPEFPLGEERLSAPPMIVGMGPAGLFAALWLARAGYRPVLIDRGDRVEDRVRRVESFRSKGILDTESNVQFGAGGAGTFSDGKLVTRIHDPLCRSVLETLHDFGAPDDILVRAKPHIGTDILRGVVDGMLSEIRRLGGTVLYRCRMDDFTELADGTISVRTSTGETVCGALILAPGHSARDTYRMLIGKQFAIEAKPMSIGVRVEHLQEEIDRALYGSFAGTPNLGHAEYALSDTRGPRGVYTFCMCPGGEVIAAASEEGGVVVNGMSNRARDGANANAAVAVSLSCDDYEPVDGSAVLGAIALQRRIEQAAFRAGGGDYFAPVMTLGDFLSGKCGTEPGRIQPSYRFGQTRVADFHTVFPGMICDGLRYAFASFGRKIPGYDVPDAVLTAAETRTSAPLRILRLPETLCAIGHDRVFPCGEGAGYAGGITSAAVDGIRVAGALMKRFGGIGS